MRDLAAFLGEFERIGGHGLFGSYVNTDDRNSDRYLFHITQGGLGLPDESYYRDDKFAEIREKYVGYLTDLLALGRHEDAPAAAATILGIDTQLAAGHWERAETRDVQKSYNLMTAAELKELCPAFDWDAYVTNLGASDIDAELVLAEVCVRQPSFLAHLSTVLESVPIEDWKAWLLAHVLRSAAPYLTDDFVETNFDFYGRTLNGTPELRDRWKRGVGLVEGALGEAVGKEYVARHFPPESKKQMDDLVANLIAAYRESISKLDWMSEETKQKAYEKLDTFRPKIGYPEKFRDYSALQIRKDDLMSNVAAASAFETDRELRKIGQPVDRDEWFMLPQTVNAYYNPGTNEICFPAGILQSPFFAPDGEPAENYGGIGAVIGHEVGHGFDDQGAQYDGAGNLNDWWTADDKAAFEVKSKALIEQYDGFSPRNLPGREDQRGAHRRREHRRPRRADHRPQGLRDLAGRPGVGRGPPQGLPQLGPRLADQAPRGAGASAADHRPAQPLGVPGQHRAQPRRVPRGLRDRRGRRALARPGGARPHLVVVPTVGDVRGAPATILETPVPARFSGEDCLDEHRQ